MPRLARRSGDGARRGWGVRRGRWFPVPEGPGDLRRLWAEAAALAADDLPDWLAVEDAADYRRVATVRLDTPAARAAADDEWGELELARLIVAEDRRDPGLRHLLVRRPEPEQEWSIAVCHVPELWRLNAALPAEPTLSAADVGGIAAAGVADPFLLRRPDGWHLFFEVENWRSWKGEIGHATSTDGRRWTVRGIVLSEPFHLSYPQVFVHDGAVYMVPESAQAGTVRLYRARRFPDDWEHVGDLLAGAAFADPTLLFHGGRWWLFTETSAARHDTLRLFQAAALAGPWSEHPRSPVIAGDPTVARPAGRIVAADGRLLRSAQDCTPAYGSAVRLRAITALSPTGYAEADAIPGAFLGAATGGGADRAPGADGADAPWNAAGMHHLDAVPLPGGGWLAAVDGWRWRGPAG